MLKACSLCDAVIEDAWSSQGRHSKQQRWVLELEIGSKAKCPVCTEIWERKYAWQPWMRSLDAIPSNELIAVKATRSQSDSIAVSFRFKNNRPLGSLGISTKSQEPYLAPFAQANSPSERSWIKQAIKWVSKCRSDHPACTSRTDDELPTRLVAIKNAQPQNANTRLHVRVCDRAELVPHTEYLTLSHCWGKVPFLTLKKENLEQWKQSIPWQDMPRLFQDAMFVTHILGFRYLWIDSLCIIQDEYADWLKESPTMHRIYGNAICNIAATGFPDGQQGLLPTARTHEIIPRRIKPEFKTRSHSWYPSHTWNWDIDNKEWLNEITRSPLHSRGWVYQEQIMAQRILHFTEKQIYWECCSSHASEVLPRGFPPFTQLSMNMKENIKPMIDREHPLHLLYVQWHNIVHEYTRGNLTFAQDKLTAISGLAKSIPIQDDYLAGLWRKNLLADMLWIPASDATAAIAYRAPTWSWASVDGQIGYDRAATFSVDTKYFAHILSAETIPLVSEEPSGQIKGGSILISGPLRQVTIEKDPKKTSDGSGYVVAMKYSGVIRDANSLLSQTLSEKTRIVRLDLSVYAIDAQLTGRLFMMHLYNNPWLPSFKLSPPYHVSYGIILRSKNTRGEFDRVGSFKTFSNICGQYLVNGTHNVEQDDYLHYDGDSNYTIRIL